MEKRKYRRFKLTDKVKIQGLNEAVGVDASVKGICVILDKKMKINETVELEFTFPDIPKKCVCKAIVMRQKKVKKSFETGFKFEKFHLTIKT